MSATSSASSSFNPTQINDAQSINGRDRIGKGPCAWILQKGEGSNGARTVADSGSMGALRSVLPRLSCVWFATLLFVLGFVSPVLALPVVQFSGVTPVNSSAVPRTVTVMISTSGSISSIKVRTQGNDGFDYSNAGGGSCTTSASYSAGQQCTVVVGFNPTVPGERRGAVTLVSSSGVVLGTQLLDGFASGPVGVFVPGQINTVAGEAVWIYDQEGPATGTAFFLPFGVTVDAKGNLYIADTSNTRIRKVDAVTQMTSTIAGNGSIGGTGDGGAATQATLSGPTSLVLDPSGNVFFSDSGNNVVRKINVFNGNISTVVGTIGAHGYTGDGGLATSATLSGPNGLAFDSAGDLYIADTGNNVIREVNAITGVISTLTGAGYPGYQNNGTAAGGVLSSPWGVAVAANGDVYIADQNNNIIRKIDSLGHMTTVAGIPGAQGPLGDGGQATAAQLNEPAAVVLDVAGNLYISDSGNNVIRKVNAVTGVITTVVGDNIESMSGDGGPATRAGIYGPYTLALDGQGSLIFADVFHNRIRKVSSNQATLDYPAMRVGRVSAPQQQTLENDGNAPLNVASITAVSMAQVDQASTTCSLTTPLAVLGQCMVGVDFAPTMTGSTVEGSVSVGSNASNTPGVITVEGEVQNTDPTTLNLTSSLNPSTVGQTITFVVTATSAGSTPTGTVNLLDGTMQVATGTLQPGGTISFNVSTLTAGQHSMTAQYLGDVSNGTATSAALIQVVRALVAATSTSLTSNINPLNAGATVQFTATVTVVTPGSGSGAITGNMVFSDGVNQLGSANVSNGVATLNVSTLAVGTHNVIASYGGNATYSSSRSAALAEVVQIASSRTALSTSANPSIAGAPLTLTAVVLTTGGTATGTVSFLDGGVSLGSAVLNQGTATLMVPGSAWNPGTHVLTASYGGDASDTGSISATVSEVINVASTTTVVTSALNPVGLGGLVTFSATVTSNRGGIPTGTVQFFDGITLLGAGTLNGTSVATFSTAALAVGSHPIKAVYGGDTYDSASTSVSMIEVVQPATVSIAFSSSGNPVVYQSPLILTAKVIGTGSVPVGTVSFTDAGIAIGSATLNASGVATFTTSLLDRGVHPLVATYGGDANHASVTSSVINENIKQATATTLTSNVQTSIAGLPVVWTAKATGLSGKSLTGTVGLYDGSALVATLTLDANGMATYSSSTLTPGQHTLTANYSGDAIDFQSASGPVTNTETAATTTTTLSTNANPVNSGTPLVLTSTVSGNGGAPTGNVTFLDGTTVIGVAPLTSAGGVTKTALTLSTLAPGIHKLSASYGGDALDRSSVSPTISEQVAQKTSILLASSANPSLLTDNVTITVTVSNGAPTAIPTGQVTLTDNGSAVGTVALNAGGIAVFTLTAPALGVHTLVASYAGDSQNLPATTQPTIQTVTLRPTTDSLTLSTREISAGQSVTLISVVQGSGPRPPSGIVTFASGATILGAVAIDGSGLATLTVKPAQAVYNVVSTYAGDSLYAPSNSAPTPLVVGPPTEFALTMTPSTMTLKSGDHGSLQIGITTATTFVDTLAIGCAGLPQAATCTFSENDIKVSGGLAKTITVMVDTGDPLGAGAKASLEQRSSSGNGILACILPAGLLAIFFARRRMRRPLGLFLLLLLTAGIVTLSGCSNSFSMTQTPAGSYTFQIVGSGDSTGATEAGTVQLTVTQ